MHFYSPSLGYIPRASYRPSLVSTYLDDETSSPLAFEGLGHLAFSHSFSPRLDAETRYRSALHELQAAEEEFEAHLTLRRARQAAILREHAARRDRALAIQAEVERIERARAVQAELAEEYARRQRALQAQVALDRARRQEHELRHAFVDANPRDLFASEHPFARTRPTHCRPSRRPVFHRGEVPTLEGLLRPFVGTHPHTHDPLQQSGSPVPSQHRCVEPQPSKKQDVETDALSAVLEFIYGLSPHAKEAANGAETQDVETDALSAVLEFIHGFAAHAKEAANGSETVPEPRTIPQPQAAPVDEKGKGRAKAEPTAGPTLLQTLLGAYAQGPSDQELKDIELAIKLSLEDRNTPDAKKASSAKAPRSSRGASSSKVKVDGAVPSSSTPSSASGATSATSMPIPGPVPRPVSPLTMIRAVRNQFSNLQSTFKFPSVLDFDQSVLSISPINAPLRTYENTLNGLLEQLDAIDSDGDEEVRNVRREVVREVEKALKDLERRVGEQASRLQVRKDVEVKGYGVQAEEPEASAPLDAAPAEATLVTKGAEATVREPSAAIPPADAAVNLAISEGYPPAPSAVESSKPAVAKFGSDAIVQTADEDVSSLDADETALASEDSSDSVATITATPPSRLSDVYVQASPVPETFLASMSHDQFTFPPRPTSSDADASPAGAHDDAVLVDNSEEGESVKSGEDGWSEVDA
ncbi:hypothetical protein EDB85DRAFT_1890932 [Lactarius pseudohatsudake]|nr:hypothetical protein EDB85DRAFT_1890932 [Lactarius pseudohatsudake]